MTRRHPSLVREAIAFLGDNGYAADLNLDGAHLKVRWLGRSGRQHLLVLSRSPSDRRASMNSRATLRRLLREEERPQ
jgi:hypothetical protein